MQDLQTMSRIHPHLVRPLLLDIEPSLVRTLATFRTELARAAETCGLPTSTLPSGSSGGETMSEANAIPTVWADKCPVSDLDLAVIVTEFLTKLVLHASLAPLTPRRSSPILRRRLTSAVVRKRDGSRAYAAFPFLCTVVSDEAAWHWKALLLEAHAVELIIDPHVN